MPVTVQCPRCGEKVKVLTQRLGNRTRCPECQGTFEVPPGAVSKLVGMLKVTLVVLALVGVLAAVRYTFGLNWHADDSPTRTPTTEASPLTPP
jgi:hypothetical protein